MRFKIRGNRCWQRSYTKIPLSRIKRKLLCIWNRAHRHTPEIEQCLSDMAKDTVNVTFTPHLIPINRGILSTIYCYPKEKINIEDIHNLYSTFYKEEPL